MSTSGMMARSTGACAWVAIFAAFSHRAQVKLAETFRLTHSESVHLFGLHHRLNTCCSLLLNLPLTIGQVVLTNLLLARWLLGCLVSTSWYSFQVGFHHLRRCHWSKRMLERLSVPVLSARMPMIHVVPMASWQNALNFRISCTH